MNYIHQMSCLMTRRIGFSRRKTEKTSANMSTEKKRVAQTQRISSCKKESNDVEIKDSQIGNLNIKFNNN